MSTFKDWIKERIWKIQLKRRIKKNHGNIGRILFCRKPKFINFGNKVRIKNYCRIECYETWNNQQSFSPNLSIGSGVIIGDFFTAFITDHVNIGENSIIAHNVTIVSENHGTNPMQLYSSQNLISKPVFIGKNCWIGANVVILPGVCIGDNCIIAAGAIVNKSFDCNSMIAGVPAKAIKKYDFGKEEWIKESDGKN